MDEPTEPKVVREKIRSARDMQDKILAPLVTQWESRISAAQKEKMGFAAVARQCDKFFRGDTRFMWENEFRDEFMPGLQAPGIQITLAKAFELVAIFGPTLFWQYPTRLVSSQKGVEPEAIRELFGEAFDDLLQSDEQRHKTAKVRNSLFQMYLNWSQAQQPVHGLAREAELCITEALVKGRGCAWTQDYVFPGSDDTFTGTFYDSVDNLLIDPDCTDPELRTATWIARHHKTPVWEVERLFGLDKGSLRSHANQTSGEAQSRASSDSGKQNTNDMIEWWEIWSRGGVGTLMRDSDREIGDAIDQVVGDFTYCCVAKGVPYFLNATGKQMFRAKPDEIANMFHWRTANFGSKWEAWRDGQWPVTLLDFYPVPNSAWPLAPMAPGLGELIAMNVLLTSYVEVSWENRKQIIAVMENAAEDIRNAVQSTRTTEYVKLNPVTNQSVKDLVQILQRPPANTDILKALDMLSQSFDKRTGLSEILYSISSHQIRVAADANNRQENASIRPEKMAQSVAAWMSRIASNEISLASRLVKAESLNHLLGPVGAPLWKMFVETADSNALMREMICTVEASDMMRPNREKNMMDLQSLSQYMLPVYQKYAEATGDSRPLNGFLQAIGEAMDRDIGEWEMGPWQPQPDPQAQQMAMQQAALEMQNVQADTTLKQSQAAAQMATAQTKQSEPMMKQLEFQLNQQQAQAQLQMKAMEAQQKLALRQAEAQQKLAQKAAEHQMSLVHKETDHMQTAEQRAADHLQSIIQDGTIHEQDLEQTEEVHDQSLTHQDEENAVKLKLMQAEAALRKKEAKKSGNSSSDSK